MPRTWTRCATSSSSENDSTSSSGTVPSPTLRARSVIAAAFAPLTPAVRMMPSGRARTAAGESPFSNSFKKRPWIVDAAVLALPEGIMRTAGVSGAKAAAITDLARKVGDGTVPLDDVESFSDDELVAHLVQVRGIGRWTAEMFLIFQLRRLDVWPVDDY